jgi:mono/diheme cytochrome c family protein
MEEEHPLELAEIQAGVAHRPVSMQEVKRRRAPFLAVFGAVSLLMLIGIYWFATFEETAITTVPPAEDVVVFAPLTPTPFPTSLPTSTPRPTSTPTPTAEPGAPTSVPEAPVTEAAITWDDGVADLFQEKCGACHSEANALGSLDLSSYEATLAGGNAGPAIQAGDPDASGLVILQAEGGHPGQFSDEELDLIRQWITGGALETPAPESEGETPAVEDALTWGDGIAELFQAKCGMCHSETNALGGLDLSSYEATLAGGNAGPAIQAGDPEASGLILLQAEGGHPGQFTEEELAQIHQWIEQGAQGP